MPAGGTSNTAEDRPVRRRVRTGCQRCRIRRRKCDERKPICSNCADRNFECRYGLQLRFPAGNARTAPQIERTPTTQYTQIRFADDPDDNNDSRQTKGNTRTAIARHASNALPSDAADQSFTHQRRHSTASTRTSGRHEDVGEGAQQSHRATVSAVPDRAEIDRIHRFDSSHNRHAHFASLAPLEPESAEHGAIQSLVSLATSVDQHFVFEEDVLSHSQILTASEDGQLQHDSAHQLSALESSSVTASTILAQSQKSPVDSLSEDRDVELLRYYRYHVAPWLDMLDLDQHLGLHLPAIGSESPSTIHALYALSARHRELSSGVPEVAQFESDRYYNMSKWGAGAIESAERPDTLEARIIRLLVDLISAPLSSWTRQLGANSDLIAPLYAYAFNAGLPASLFWCILRFDLTAALVNETLMAINLEFVLSQNRFLDGLPNLAHELGPTDNLDPNCVDQYALRALCLYGMAIGILQNFRQQEAGEECPDRTRPQDLIARWESTWTTLSSWYTGRHKFVRPLLELSLSAGEDGEPNAFPTIIFTTAAAALANLAYHTAAMIMLDCKPKTLKIPGQHSPVASMHWHAQRTCAIAVGNESFQNWDPCMIACVLHAARKMTHRDHQTAVLETLKRGREITGWKIDDELHKLQEYWRLAEHT